MSRLKLHCWFMHTCTYCCVALFSDRRATTSTLHSYLKCLGSIRCIVLLLCMPLQQLPPLFHALGLTPTGSLDSGAMHCQACSLAYLLRLLDSTLAYLDLHDSTRCVCIAGQLEALNSASKGSWVSSPKQSFRAEDRRAEGRRASTGSSASLTRSSSVKSKLHSRQPPHVQVHWLCTCVRARACIRVCVCVCVCVAPCFVNQALAAQTSG